MRNTHFFVATLALATVSLVLALCLEWASAVVGTPPLLWVLSAAVLAFAVENWTLMGDVREARAKAESPAVWDKILWGYEEAKAETFRNLSAENRALGEANLSLHASLKAFQDLSFSVLHWQVLVHKARALHLRQRIELERIDWIRRSRRVHRSSSAGF
jgi:hypothetical protein